MYSRLSKLCIQLSVTYILHVHNVAAVSYTHLTLPTICSV